jgi:hypothetical protein
MTLSLDMTALFTNASTIVNALWPIAAIGIGFSLGFAILKMVQGAIGGARGR